jgi:rare lipoprotein A
MVAGMRRAFLLGYVLLSAGCAARHGDAKQAGSTGGGCEQGEATYYSDVLTGRKTASGEPYDPRAFTAAHRDRRFGSWVRVSYGNRDVTVRVNDRGPFSRGAVIDLSRAAAESLGMVRAGRVAVRVCPAG